MPHRLRTSVLYNCIAQRTSPERLGPDISFLNLWHDLTKAILFTDYPSCGFQLQQQPRQIHRNNFTVLFRLVMLHWKVQILPCAAAKTPSWVAGAALLPSVWRTDFTVIDLAGGSCILYLLALVVAEEYQTQAFLHFTQLSRLSIFLVVSPLWFLCQVVCIYRKRLWQE